MASIKDALEMYLDNIRLARSEHTYRAYKNALSNFFLIITEHGIAIENPASEIPEDAIAWFAAYLKNHSPATEQLYLTATAGFFEFLSAEQLSSPNLPRVRLLIRQRGRRSGIRLPQFPRESIDKIVDYFSSIPAPPFDNENAHLRYLRNASFILCLADTGLRVHEACAIRRGDMDWNEGKAVVLGKGDQEAIVRFSARSLRALRTYLHARANLDGHSGRPLPSLPLFSRHDRGAGKKVKPITPTTGRNIVAEVVTDILGEEAIGTITPHSFRHYFVTTILRASGGNLKLAQNLARHRNIQVTQRYAHLADDELDRGYHEIFNRSS